MADRPDRSAADAPPGDAAPDGDTLLTLFGEASELTGEARAAFVAAVTDDALRAELERLLGAADRSDGFLDRLARDVLPAATPALSDSLPDEALPGDLAGEDYELLEPIGAGGGGRVFKARERALDRLVALKFLTGSPSPARVERALAEARAASGLDHANIAAVYRVGVAGGGDEGGDGDPGRPFIAMPFYAGETVGARLRRGPVGVARALDWMTQAAAGLARAHAAGIVHRDIKPENLIVAERNVVKILDFGIAALAGEVAALPAGTLPYMSPEQLRGETVTPATDVWAAGVVLYELLTGVRPYRGSTRTELLTAITADAGPPPLPSADVPEAVARVVERALAPDPAQRLQSGEELLHELRVAARSLARDARPRVVVLPFATISPDASKEYFSDGVTEEVITHLSGVSAIRVLARGTTMRLKGDALDPVAAGQRVGVDYAVEGGVRLAGDRVRVSVRLVNVATGEGVWADRFDGTLEEVFEIQERVARGVVAGLSVTLSEAESQSLRARRLPDLETYDLLLRARHEAWRFSAPGIARARELLETALARAGDNALLYGTLGHTLAMAIETGIAGGPDALDQVDALADQVFSLDADAPRGHWLKAFVAFQRGDVRRALRSSQRALALDPEDPDTLILTGYILCHAGRDAEALPHFERAIARDPLTPVNQCMPGFVALMQGRFDDAVPAYRRTFELDAASPFAQACMGWALAYAGRDAEAIEIFAQTAAAMPGTPFGAWAEAFRCGLAGDAEGARRAIIPPFEGAAMGSGMFARALAHAWVFAGDHARALAALERAVALGLWNEAFLAEHDRFIAPLRGEPGFAALLARVRRALGAGEGASA